MSADKRERYLITCPVCTKEQYAKKSLFMESGWLNSGSAWCLQCSTWLHLQMDESGTQMIVDCSLDALAHSMEESGTRMIADCSVDAFDPFIPAEKQ